MELYRELSEQEQRKLKSIERRLKKIDSEINEMGFKVIHHSNSWQIIEGEPFTEKGKRIHGCERYDMFDLKSDWGTIDW